MNIGGLRPCGCTAGLCECAGLGSRRRAEALVRVETAEGHPNRHAVLIGPYVFDRYSEATTAKSLAVQIRALLTRAITRAANARTRRELRSLIDELRTIYPERLHDINTGVREECVRRAVARLENVGKRHARRKP